MQTSALPVQESERLQALDLLRGCAVLGILAMNIQLFTMPYAAYFNPYALGEPSVSDLTIWSITHVLADQKFMTIFSLLFGAGVLLMTSRAGDRGANAGRVHYRRMTWLLVFGLAHAYLLWHGDILVLYAICGMVVFPARNLSARTLAIAGVAALAVGSGIMLLGGLTMETWPAAAVAEWQKSWTPPPEELAAETAAFQGGWLEQQPWRASYSAEFHLQDILFWGLWRAGGLMLLGMALFKFGILPGARTQAFYAKQMAVGLAAGLALVAWGLMRHHATGWNMRDSFFLVAQWNYWGSILVSLGYIGLLLTLWKSGAVRALTGRLSVVGRMAFSCYIFETLISTLVFYGHGLGLFGTVNRVEQMLFTAGVWAVMLIAAPLWLSRFRYGPLEWVWRSLTYGRLEPLGRRSPAVLDAV
jgi:uncharacterized protein